MTIKIRPRLTAYPLPVLPRLLAWIEEDHKRAADFWLYAVWRMAHAEAHAVGREEG